MNFQARVPEHIQVRSFEYRLSDEADAMMTETIAEQLLHAALAEIGQNRDQQGNKLDYAWFQFLGRNWTAAMSDEDATKLLIWDDDY
jgi:hypothetical protein